jgi:hypothetical protein
VQLRSFALENRDYSRRGSAALTTRHASVRKKLALTYPTNGGRSVSIVRSQTKVTEFVALKGLEYVRKMSAPPRLGTVTEESRIRNPRHIEHFTCTVLSYSPVEAYTHAAVSESAKCTAYLETPTVGQGQGQGQGQGSGVSPRGHRTQQQQLPITTAHMGIPSPRPPSSFISNFRPMTNVGRNTVTWK